MGRRAIYIQLFVRMGVGGGTKSYGGVETAASERTTTADDQGFRTFRRRRTTSSFDLQGTARNTESLTYVTVTRRKNLYLI